MTSVLWLKSLCKYFALDFDPQTIRYCPNEVLKFILSVLILQKDFIVKRIKFQNSHDGYNKLIQAVRKLNQPVEFAMEATGHLALRLPSSR